MRIITIICWLVAAGALVGLAIWFLTGTVFGIRSDRIDGSGWSPRWSVGFNIGGWETLTGPYEVAGEYNVSTAGVSSVKVDWIAGNINVTPYDGADVKITEYAQRQLQDSEKLYISTSGNTLTIRFRERSFSGNMPQKKLDVLIPRSLCENMNDFLVDSASSGIYVEGVGAATFRIDSISGSVNVLNIRSGNFKANSSSGSITVASIRADDMKIESISGSVHVTASSAKTIDGDTTSGSVSIEGAYDDVKLNSISGRMTLDNSSPLAELKAETSSGSMDLSGAFDKVKTSSISGTTTVRSRIIPSALKIDTTSGSIHIYVPNEGTISVRHSSTSGRFSSDIPVTMQNSNAMFDISSISGSARIYVLN